jgi:hypothetical protein
VTDIGHWFSGEMWKVSRRSAIGTERELPADVLKLFSVNPSTFSMSVSKLVAIFSNNLS